MNHQILEEKLESTFKRVIDWMKGSGARFYRTTPEKLPSELFWGEYLCELKWEAYQLFCETLYPEEEDVTEFMFDDEHEELLEWFENRLIREQKMAKMESYPVKTAEDAFDLVLFALDMEIVKKDIARENMEEKGDVWEVDRCTHEINGLKSFKQLLDKLIEMQK